MAVCAFMGDEVSAAGFRLAGVDVHVPTATQAEGLFRRLLGDSQLVLITAEVAERLPVDLLQSALISDHPLILIIPDIRRRIRPPDLSFLVRRRLGMAE